MKIFLVSVVFVYLITAFHFFILWLDWLLPDSSTSLQKDLLILREVLVGAILWPVVLIIADIHSSKHDALEEVSTNHSLLPSVSFKSLQKDKEDANQQPLDARFGSLKR